MDQSSTDPGCASKRKLDETSAPISTTDRPFKNSNSRNVPRSNDRVSLPIPTISIDEFAREPDNSEIAGLLSAFYSNGMPYLPFLGLPALSSTTDDVSTSPLDNTAIEDSPYPYTTHLPNFLQSQLENSTSRSTLQDQPSTRNNAINDLDSEVINTLSTPTMPSILNNAQINANTVLDYVTKLCIPSTDSQTTSGSKMHYYEPFVSLLFDPTLNLASLPLYPSYLNQFHDKQAEKRRLKELEGIDDRLQNATRPFADKNDQSEDQIRGEQPCLPTSASAVPQPRTGLTLPPTPKSPFKVINSPRTGEDDDNRQNQVQPDINSNSTTVLPTVRHAEMLFKSLPNHKIPKCGQFFISTKKNATKPWFDSSDKVIIEVSPELVSKLNLKHILHAMMNFFHTFSPLQSLPLYNNNQNGYTTPPKTLPSPFSATGIPAPPIITLNYPSPTPHYQKYKKSSKDDEMEDEDQSEKVDLSWDVEQRVLYDIHASMSVSMGKLQTITPSLYNYLSLSPFPTAPSSSPKQQTPTSFPVFAPSGINQLPIGYLGAARGLYSNAVFASVFDHFSTQFDNSTSSNSNPSQIDSTSNTMNTGAKINSHSNVHRKPVSISTDDQYPPSLPNIHSTSHNHTTFLLNAEYRDNIFTHSLFLKPPLAPILSNPNHSSKRPDQQYTRLMEINDPQQSQSSTSSHDLYLKAYPFFTYESFQDTCFVNDISNELNDEQKDALTSKYNSKSEGWNTHAQSLLVPLKLDENGTNYNLMTGEKQAAHASGKFYANSGHQHNHVQHNTDQVPQIISAWTPIASSSPTSQQSTPNSTHSPLTRSQFVEYHYDSVKSTPTTSTTTNPSKTAPAAFSTCFSASSTLLPTTEELTTDEEHNQHQYRQEATQIITPSLLPSLLHSCIDTNTPTLTVQSTQHLHHQNTDNSHNTQSNTHHNQITPVIPQTIIAHSIPAINHLYSPVHLNSKPIIGICLVIRGVSGSGKSSTTSAILNNRANEQKKIETRSRSTMQDDSHCSAARLDKSTSKLPLLKKELDLGEIDHDMNIILSSDALFEFPAQYSLIPSKSHSKRPTDVDNVKPHQTMIYAWESYLLELTHYFCRARAHNFMLRHWTRCLSTPSTQLPSTQSKLPQSVEQLPLVIIDNTNLSPKQLFGYFLSCVLHGFVMINVEPTTPWSAFQYGQFRQQVQQIDATIKQLYFKEISTKSDSMNDVSEDIGVSSVDDVDLLAAISKFSSYDAENPSAIKSTVKIDDTESNGGIPLVDRLKFDPAFVLQMKELILQREALCAKMDQVCYQLFQRNTHQVPFDAIMGMLRMYEPVRDVYDLFRVK